MSTPSLGRLEKVDLRTAWMSESSDFTPWLAQPENLKLLGEAVGIDLEFEAQERDVGPFRADILCKDTLDGSWVLIENQLERTDHTHLGQLLTYASGLETVTIIWISQRFTEEHRATLDWLNEITNERFAFFGLEIELWRIGNSPVAPKFNIVSKPNDWSRTIRTSAVAASELTETKQKQLEFWTGFKEYMDEHSHIRCPKPLPQTWMNHTIGRSGFGLSSIASTWNSEKATYEGELRVEFYIAVPDARRYFDVLQRDKNAIEAEIGEPLIWFTQSDRNQCKVLVRSSTDFFDRSKWPQQHEWLQGNLERFHRTFSPRVKQLTLSKSVSGINEPTSDSSIAP